MKYALVTGSTRGIGLAIADKLSENGYEVIKTGRSGGNVTADLSTLEGVNKVADTVLKENGKLDVLVLNAGTTCRKPMKDMTYDAWQEVMNTNLNMPFFLVQRLSDNISNNGSIVFISSEMSFKPHATSIPYGVSKAAVNMLAQYLVKEFAPRGIRVNVICPGFIETKWQKRKPVWLREKIEGKIALGKFGQPQEVADMCLSIINNGYINGAAIVVDGGYDMK